MAIEFIQAVWEISPYKAEKLLVQIACADWANADGEFWPTYDDIAHKARVTKPGAIGIIQQMIEDGEIEIKEHSAGGRGKRNRYRFSDDYLQAVGKVRQAWAEARERKGKRGLPKSEREKVNEDYRIKTEKVNENGIKGKPEIAHIRNNRHEPSERERGALVSPVEEKSDQPFSPNDDHSVLPPEPEWTAGERFILKACGLWQMPIVETDWKIKQSVKTNGAWVNARLDVKNHVGGTPDLFKEFWFDVLGRKTNPRPDYVLEQWAAYDRWLIETHETHRRRAA